MSTTDPRMSRFSQYQSQQPSGSAPQREPVPGLLALSISHTTHTYRYENCQHQNGSAHAQHAPSYMQQMVPPHDQFEFDSDSENGEQDIDEMYGEYSKTHAMSPRYGYDLDDYEALSEEIGRRHAAPAKRRLAAAKQARSAPSSQNRPQSGASGVFVETDIDTGEVQVVRPPAQPDGVRSAKSVGDLVDSSPRRIDAVCSPQGVSPSDRDKSKSVTFDKDGQFADNSLSKPRSRHDVRVDKSLERINVPEWYREGGDEEEDSQIFRLKSLHDDEYYDYGSHIARRGAFNRTKSAPPARKNSTSSAPPNPIEAFRQSRHWALGRAVGAESRASTTASTASHFRRPSVRYAEKDASLRRPKPISIRPLEAVLHDEKVEERSRSPSRSARETKQTVMETEVRTSTFSFHKSSEHLAENGRSSPQPTKKPLKKPAARFVPEPKQHVAKESRASPVQIPVETQPPTRVISPPSRVISPAGPPTYPKPKSKSPSPVPVQQNIPVKNIARRTTPSPAHSGSGLLVMQEEVYAPALIKNSTATNSQRGQVAVPVALDECQFEMMDSDDVVGINGPSGRRPVLLAGYDDAETYVEENVVGMDSDQNGLTSPPRTYLSPSPCQEVPPKTVEEQTPFVFNDKPVMQPFHRQNAHKPSYVGYSSRVTDIDDVPIVISPSSQSASHKASTSPPVVYDTSASGVSSSVSAVSPIPAVEQMPPSQKNLGSSGSSLGPSPPPQTDQALIQESTIRSNGSSKRSSSMPPVAWKTSNVVPSRKGNEVVYENTVEMKMKRPGERNGRSKLSAPDTATDNYSNMSLDGSANPSFVNYIEQSTIPIHTSNNFPPDEMQPNEDATASMKRSSAGGSSSIRASFKKPGKFFSKLWKPEVSAKDSKTLPLADEEPVVPPSPPPPEPPRAPPIEPPQQPRPQSMHSSEPVPPEPVRPLPSKSTDKVYSAPSQTKSTPLRTSFRQLFWRPERAPKMETTVEETAPRQAAKPGVMLSKSSHHIPSQPEPPKPPVADDSLNTSHQTTINESMTISEMSTSVISEPPRDKPIKTSKHSIFSPAKWISGRSPAKPLQPKAELNGNAATANGHGPSHRDDVEKMMGDQPVGFRLCEMPEEKVKPPAAVKPRAQPKTQPPQSQSAMSNGSRYDYRNYDSVSRVSSRFGSEREPDAISTTSSQKSKKSRSIFKQIMDYQEEHDHGGHAYTRHYAPPPTGEAASWLNRRDVTQLVSATITPSGRPSNPNTPSPGSPVSGKSMTLPGSKIGSDAFSLTSQVHNQQYKPDFNNLASSYHGGMSTSSHSLAKDRDAREQQPQPPSGPYSRQLQAAQPPPASNYHALMAHQQKIRQQMPPPPARLNPAAPPPHPQVNIPPPSKPIIDFSPPVTCQRPGCSHTVSAERARHEFRVCSSCGSTFCSKQCREDHLVGNVGKRRCPLDNVRDLCQRAAKRLETDRLLVALLSQFARMSYLCHGRGYVYAHFSGPDRAGAFSSGQMGLHSLALEFHTITHTEAALMRGEPLEEVMDLLQAYNPESKLVLCVGVSVATDRLGARPRPQTARLTHGGGIGSASHHVTSWDTAALEDLNAASGESRVVLRAAKIRLAVPRPGSLRALLLVSAGVAFQNRRGNMQRMREITFANIQAHLKKRGVDLLASHPNVYTRLTQYVSGSQEFPPTGLCIWDSAVGRSLLALIFPDALPRQDWLRSLHQLGDVELGLPDPRQLGMGVDV